MACNGVVSRESIAWRGGDNEVIQRARSRRDGDPVPFFFADDSDDNGIMLGAFVEEDDESDFLPFPYSYATSKSASLPAVPQARVSGTKRRKCSFTKNISMLALMNPARGSYLNPMTTVKISARIAKTLAKLRKPSILVAPVASKKEPALTPSTGHLNHIITVPPRQQSFTPMCVQNSHSNAAIMSMIKHQRLLTKRQQSGKTVGRRLRSAMGTERIAAYEKPKKGMGTTNGRVAGGSRVLGEIEDNDAGLEGHR
ncbi:uncharacterized protein HMPREF1541_08373 [Cyphellophora europaea CBS 101466]|uniref:Uncharacterized protein n=1 Tax=Cyphellophora europaea (strain CBS 101466) TaxID=1220924 RepID=W2RLP5_CYPE1|nr:uncharacterized protein HMPREF1541_08373 [Cyphellophora europaea CBS 101466]ETN37382.1 hypothetical protein HMPREF1541_08373 [Cyphellophora europaea CBS 101466]